MLVAVLEHLGEDRRGDVGQGDGSILLREVCALGYAARMEPSGVVSKCAKEL